VVGRGGKTKKGGKGNSGGSGGGQKRSFSRDELRELFRLTPRDAEGCETQRLLGGSGTAKAVDAGDGESDESGGANGEGESESSTGSGNGSGSGSGSGSGWGTYEGPASVEDPCLRSALLEHEGLAALVTHVHHLRVNHGATIGGGGKAVTATKGRVHRLPA